MGKTIRPSYPLEYSIGLLLLIFAISLFLSGQIFNVVPHNLNDGKNVYFGMFLVSISVIIMVIVLWEELLFPVKVKPEDGEVIFRNHRTKLKMQLLIYCAIPVIFGFVYLEYAVNQVRFFIWAGICIIAPVAGKLISGLNNYNDFLKLTMEMVSYKNNEKEGSFEVKQIQHLRLVKDERKILHKIELLMMDGNSVIIDLDEMELESFLNSIDKYITIHYPTLIKKD